jgi:hypothetical protein
MFTLKIETQHKSWCEDSEPYWLTRINAMIGGCEDCPRLMLENMLAGVAPMLRGEIIRLTIGHDKADFATLEGLLTDEMQAEIMQEARPLFA